MDAALTFLIPNYAMLANMTLVGVIITSFVDMPGRVALLSWFMILLAAQILYFIIGTRMSNLPTRALVSVSFAPVFLIWRMAIDLIAVLHLKDSVWVRTSRVTNAEKRKAR